MINIDNIKILLGKENDDTVDEILSLLIGMCQDDCVVYCNISEYDSKLDNIVVNMVIERYNQMGVENIKNQSSSGVSASFFDFYSDRVIKMLNKHRKVRTV